MHFGALDIDFAFYRAEIIQKFLKSSRSLVLFLIFLSIFNDIQHVLVRFGLFLGAVVTLLLHPLEPRLHLLHLPALLDFLPLRPLLLLHTLALKQFFHFELLFDILIINLFHLLKVLFSERFSVGFLLGFELLLLFYPQPLFSYFVIDRSFSLARFNFRDPDEPLLVVPHLALKFLFAGLLLFVEALAVLDVKDGEGGFVAFNLLLLDNNFFSFFHFDFESRGWNVPQFVRKDSWSGCVSEISN